MKYILVLLSLVSCGLKKPIKPDWIKTRPTDSSYYIGIGMVKKNKSQFSNEYVESAKKNALNDMAGEIATKISSNSVLNTMDLGNSFNEEFISNIKTTTNLDLDGYEQVGNYEDENEYWIYYRLNKASYQFKQKQKQDVAVSKSTDFYKKAQIFKNDFDYASALNYYINSLESLKEYFGESLETTINGKKVFLANEIISEINNIFKDIKIETLNNRISIKKGTFIGEDNLVFYIKSIKSGNIIKNIPLEFSYTERPISNSRGIIYNTDGSVSYVLGKVSSRKNVETFGVKIAIMDMVRKTTQDPFIIKISEKIQVPKINVIFDIKQSSIFIKISQKNIGNDINSELLEIITTNFEKEQIKVLSKENEADFTLKIDVFTKEKENLLSGRVYSTILSAKFEVLNNKGVVYFKYNLDNLEGRGNSYLDAGMSCYKELEKEVRFKISKQIYREVFEK